MDSEFEFISDSEPRKVVSNSYLNVKELREAHAGIKKNIQLSLSKIKNKIVSSQKELNIFDWFQNNSDGIYIAYNNNFANGFDFKIDVDYIEFAEELLCCEFQKHFDKNSYVQNLLRCVPLNSQFLEILENLTKAIKEEKSAPKKRGRKRKIQTLSNSEIIFIELCSKIREHLKSLELQ